MLNLKIYVYLYVFLTKIWKLEQVVTGIWLHSQDWLIGPVAIQAVQVSTRALDRASDVGSFDLDTIRTRSYYWNQIIEAFLHSRAKLFHDADSIRGQKVTILGLHLGRPRLKGSSVFFAKPSGRCLINKRTRNRLNLTHFDDKQSHRNIET